MDDLGDVKDGELPLAEHTALDGIVWRKLDRRLIPLCTGWFILAVLVSPLTRAPDVLQSWMYVGQDQHREFTYRWLTAGASDVGLSSTSTDLNDLFRTLLIDSTPSL